MSLTAALAISITFVAVASGYSPNPQEPPPFKKMPTNAKPSGQFHKLLNVHVGNNGWSSKFTLDGVERSFCEKLAWHKDITLTILVYEDWIDEHGKIICWSIQNDKAGYEVKENPDGYPIYEPNSGRAAATESPEEAAKAAR